jgi:hypothetical protein
MSHRSRRHFDRLAPVSDRYASLSVAEAFTWDACLEAVDPGEWYMVAFRSTHYFKGPTTADGRCMSFCLWDSRAEARAASGRPAHMEAAALTHEAYADYTLEFHRVRRLAEGGFTFEPYDAIGADPSVEPTGPKGFSPQLAPS